MFESIADYQKRHFLQNESNKGKFIKSGLWSISRHPNYFGEIGIYGGVINIERSFTLTHSAPSFDVLDPVFFMCVNRSPPGHVIGF